MKQRILNLLIVIDQLIYVVITLGSGCPDETMSSAAWRLEQKGKIQGKIFRPLTGLAGRLQRSSLSNGWGS
jgi:hypothetical protein